MVQCYAYECSVHDLNIADQPDCFWNCDETGLQRQLDKGLVVGEVGSQCYKKTPVDMERNDNHPGMIPEQRKGDLQTSVQNISQQPNWITTKEDVLDVKIYTFPPPSVTAGWLTSSQKMCVVQV